MDTIVTVIKESISSVVYDFLSDGASYFYTFLDAFHDFMIISSNGIEQLGQLFSMFDFPSWLSSVLLFSVSARFLLKVWGRN